jgi:two-component sensor histidine kinase
VEDPQTPEELARIHEQLWQTVLQFGNFSASQERNRIARDLHDSLGQALTALNIQLQTAVKLWQLDPSRAEQFLEEAQRLGSTAVQEVRQTVRTLRMDCPDDQSIETLITSLVESFHRSTGVLPIVKLNLAAPVPPEVVTPVYRIIQEGLNNICKYAQATEVNLQLSTTPTSLGLIIEDNGRGFNLEHAVTGFGLRGMQERVSLLRGRFQVETEPGAGCRIRIVMPLRVLSLQDPQGLVPPPVSPEVTPPPAAVEPSSPPLAPLTEENDIQETGEPLLDGMDLTLTGESDPEEPSPLLLQGDQGAITSLDADVPPFPALVLAPTQVDRLTQILLQHVGPIAPILLQQAIAQSQQPTDLVNCLAVHFPVDRRRQFEQQLQQVFNLIPPFPSSDPELPTQTNLAVTTSPIPASHPSGDHPFAIDTELTHYCEQELTALIGPVAHFLMQEALMTSPDLSLEELVDRLAANIPNAQKAIQFKRRVLAYMS